MSDYENYIVITNRKLCQGDYLAQLEKVTALRPHALILREKDLSEAEYEHLAQDVQSLCGRQKVPCFLHSHAKTALRLGCTRIHLPVPLLREYAGTGILDHFSEISVSCHSMADIGEAAAAGASQIILGNIFETDCKKGLPGKGLDFLRQACAHTPIPIYGIGGISPASMPLLLEAGAAGGCMMSGFMKM